MDKLPRGEAECSGECVDSIRCEVCTESKSTADSLQFHPCEHWFCVDCVTHYFKIVLRGWKLAKRFECLHGGCGSLATDAQLKAILSADEFSLYERKKFTENLIAVRGIIECPVRTCGACYFLEEQQALDCSSRTPNFAECTHCKYVFCIDCRNAYHGTQPCKIDREQRKELLSKYENVETVDKNEVLVGFGGERNLAEYIANLKCDEWIDENCKQCPTCRVNVYRYVGCRNILCLMCGTSFCWSCRAVECDDPELCDEIDSDYIQEEEC